MNGTTRLDQVWVGTVPDTGYQIEGVADFDGNGKADLLWWHATRGEVWMWTMNGTTREAETWVGTVPDTNYRIAGTGDYDGDGKADILWRNAVNGEVWVWLMDGPARLSESWVATVPDLGYRVTGTDAYLINERFDASTALNPLTWGVWRESGSSSFPMVATSFGNPGYSLDGNDTCGSLCSNYVYSNVKIPYQRGVTIEFDFWCTGSTHHYTDAMIGLGREPGPGGAGWLTYYWANNYAGAKRINVYVDPESIMSATNYTSDAWHRGRLVVRPDQYVEFYLDDQLIHTSGTKLLDIGSAATLWVLGRSYGGTTYIDNIKVTQR